MEAFRIWALVGVFWGGSGVGTGPRCPARGERSSGFVWPATTDHDAPGRKLAHGCARAARWRCAAVAWLCGTRRAAKKASDRTGPPSWKAWRSQRPRPTSRQRPGIGFVAGRDRQLAHSTRPTASASSSVRCPRWRMAPRHPSTPEMLIALRQFCADACASPSPWQQHAAVRCGGGGEPGSGARVDDRAACAARRCCRSREVAIVTARPSKSRGAHGALSLLGPDSKGSWCWHLRSAGVGRPTISCASFACGPWGLRVSFGIWEQHKGP